MSWPRDFMISFIELYRSHECLWKVRSKNYSNRSKKEEAYDALVEKVREVVPTATRDTVVKKINSLRTCYRREAKKMEVSKLFAANEDEVYLPSLWYFHLLQFLRNQDTSMQETAEMSHIHDIECKLENDRHVSNSNDGSRCSFEEEPLSPNNNTHVDDDPAFGMTNDGYVGSSNASHSLMTMPMPPLSTKKRKKEMYRIEDEVLAMAHGKLLQSQMIDDDSIFGKYVGSKLSKMSDEQKTYAEKLINDVLFEGTLENLTRCACLTLNPEPIQVMPPI